MKLRPCLVLLFLILVPALARAADAPAPLTKDSPLWWLQKSADDCAKIADPKTKIQSLLYTGHRMIDRGDYTSAARISLELHTLVDKNPGVLQPYELPLYDGEVTAGQLGSAGKYAEGHAFVEKYPDAGIRPTIESTLARSVTLHGTPESLSEAILSEKLPPDVVVQCVASMINDARIRLDKKAATFAILLLPKTADSQSFLSNCISNYCFPFLGKPDPAGARFLIELMSESNTRADIATGRARTFARSGSADNAAALVPFFGTSSQRASAIGDVCRVLAATGKADEARKIIAAETDKNCIANGTIGLANGLALHGDADAARAAFDKAPDLHGPANLNEFEISLASGIILHGDFKTGLAQLTSAKDADLRSRAISELVMQLLDAAPTNPAALDRAVALASSASETTYYNLYEKGRLFRFIGDAQRAAKKPADVAATLKTVDALLSKVPEKNKKEASCALAGVHAYLSDADGALVIAATLATPEDRDAARRSAASGCAEIGDMKSLARLLAASEKKYVGPSYKDDYGFIAQTALRTGHFDGAADWIAS